MFNPHKLVIQSALAFFIVFINTVNEPPTITVWLSSQANTQKDSCNLTNGEEQKLNIANEQFWNHDFAKGQTID